MKILLLLSFLSVGTAQAQTFKVINPKVEQGGFIAVKISSQWQGSLVCISALNKDFLPNQLGDVFIGITPDTKPGKYALFLVECGRNVRLDWNFQEVEIIEKKFPETRIKRRMSKSNPAIRVKESEEIKKAYARASVWFERTEGNFVLPLDKISITDQFGRKRKYIDGETRHGGVDLKASSGTEVRAINSGVVLLTANDFSLEGNMVILDHGSGILSLYLHLSKIDAIQGTKIKKGEVLGRSGSTGSVTGPHLHFMVKAHGTNIDPLAFIDTINTLIP